MIKNMADSEQKDYLIENDYLNFKADIVNESRRIQEISITKDALYIFVYINQADRISHLVLVE